MPLCKTANAHLRIVGQEYKKLGVFIRRIYIHWERKNDTLGRYLFRFRYYRRDDAAAIRLGESFLYGLSLTGSASFMGYDDSLVLRIPDSMIAGRDSLCVDELVDLEEHRVREDRLVEFPLTTLRKSCSTTSDRFEAAWRIACITYQDPQLFEATRFLRRSHEMFFVYPGEIPEVLSDPERAPLTGSDQTRFEDALQNAFKAIEVVIGDPSKNDNKFFQKLRQIGLDPHEVVGWSEKKPLYRVIREMNVARDKKAAHGSTKSRSISVMELLEFQSCSELVVWTALETAKGEPIFPGHHNT